MLPNVTQPRVTVMLAPSEDDALRWPVGYGETVIFFNFEKGKFWSRENPNGIPGPLRSFEFTETTPQPQQNIGGNAVSREEFDALLASVNKLISDLGGDKS